MYLYIMSNREVLSRPHFFFFLYAVPNIPRVFWFYFYCHFWGWLASASTPALQFTSTPTIPRLNSQSSLIFHSRFRIGTAVEHRVWCTHSRSLLHMYLYAQISWVANVNWYFFDYGYQWVCAHGQSGEVLGWNYRCRCLQSCLSNSHLAMICLVFWTAPRVGYQAKRQAQTVSGSHVA